jgi:hypothetical protein
MPRVKKVVLWPQRLRQIPLQFSWVDHRLVQLGYLDRCDPPAAALYLFLVTVADAQGLSFYGDDTLSTRLHLNPAALHAARRRLIELELIAYAAPIYQVLAVGGATPVPTPSTAPMLVSLRSPADGAADRAGAAALLAQLRDQLEQRRGRL